MATLCFYSCVANQNPRWVGPAKIFKDGLELESRVSRFKSGTIEEAFYVFRDSSGNFIRHGEDIHFYQNGQIKFKEIYNKGKQEGTSEFWYENGTKQGELSYTDGKPNGKSITWFTNGKKHSEKNWNMGKIDGEEIEFDQKGNKIKEQLWKENEVQADSLKTKPNSAPH